MVTVEELQQLPREELLKRSVEQLKKLKKQEDALRQARTEL